MKLIWYGLSPNVILKANYGQTGLKNLIPDIEKIGNNILAQKPQSAPQTYSSSTVNSISQNNYKDVPQGQNILQKKVSENEKSLEKKISLQTRVYQLDASNDKYRIEKKLLNDDSVYSYFRKLQAQEEQNVCPHLQPNKIKPFLSTNGLYFPSVLRARSSINLGKTNGDLKQQQVEVNSNSEAVTKSASVTSISNTCKPKTTTVAAPSKMFSTPSDSKPAIKTIKIPTLKRPPTTLTQNFSNISHEVKTDNKEKSEEEIKVTSSDLQTASLAGNLDNLSRDTHSDISKFSEESQSKKDKFALSFSEYIRGKTIENTLIKATENDNVNKYNSLIGTASDINLRGIEMLNKFKQLHKSKSTILSTSNNLLVAALQGNKSVDGKVCSRNFTNVCPPIPTCGSIKKMPKKKCLPKLNFKLCPTINPEPLKDVPLSKLKKRLNPSEPGKCTKEKYFPCERADDDYKVCPKTFGKINEDYESCAKPFSYKDCAAIVRLPKKCIPEPPKVQQTISSPCPERADNNLQMKSLRLPNYESQVCPVVEAPKLPPQPIIPPTVRFAIPDPPKCLAVKKEVCVRADDYLNICKRELPTLDSGKCPKIDVTEGIKAPAIQRLTARVVEENPLHCPKPEELCTKNTQSDKGDWILTGFAGRTLKIIPSKLSHHLKQKALPKLQCHKICPVNPDVLQEGEAIKRLPKKKVLEKMDCKTDIIEKCKRADDNYCKEIKPLQNIVIPPCKPKSPVRYRDVPPLTKPHKKCVPDPPRCIEIKEKPCTTPRADASLVTAKKILPNLPVHFCPPEEHKMADILPLVRLPKTRLPEPPKICLVKKEICQRLDDNMKIKPKQLPSIEIQDTCKPSPQPYKTGLPIKRLTVLREVKEKPKVCPKKESVCIRSDQNDWDYAPMGIPGKISKQRCHPNLTRCKSTYLQKRAMSDISSLSYPADNKLFKKNCALLKQIIGFNKHMILRRNYKVVQRENIYFSKSNNFNIAFKNYSKDPEAPYAPDVDKDLQPKYPPIKSFFRIQELKPKMALEIDPELEDECIRKKLQLPNTGVTATCDNPCAKRRYLRMQNKPETPSVRECPKIETGDNCPIPNDIPFEVVKTCMPPPCPPPCCPPPPCPSVFRPPAICPVAPDTCLPEVKKRKKVSGCYNRKNKSWWQRIKEYFKARPNCPPPDAWKKKKLRMKAEKAARKAGLYLVDPAGDPQKMCQEIHKICSKSQLQRRCYYTSCGDLIRSNKLFSQLYLRSLPHTRRYFSCWKDPFEFYNIEEDDMNSLQRLPNKEFTKGENVFVLEQTEYIDLDLLREEMCKCLNVSDTPDDKEIIRHRSALNQMLECKPEELYAKKETLLELLTVIWANLENISRRSKLSIEETDTTRTLKVLDDILDTTFKKRG